MTSINLNADCNQNCIFCQRKLLLPDKIPSTENIKKQIDKIRDDNCFFMGGGEPTMRNDLKELIRYAKKRGIKAIGVETNGVKFSDIKYVRELKEAGLSYAIVSLHSHKEEISDYLTQSKDTFKKTINGIENLKKESVTISSILHTITSLNYKYIEEFVDFVYRKFEITNFSFGFIRPIAEREDNRRITPKFSEVELYLHDTLEFCKKKGFEVQISSGCSVPLCYLPENEHLNTETRTIVTKGLKEVKEELHIENKTKVEHCKICTLNKICAGIEKDYIAVRGSEEFYPVFKKSEEIINKIIQKTAEVAVVKCDGYDNYELLKKSIKDAVDRIGGFEKFIKHGDKVLIKPNLIAPSEPERAAVTHPLFVRAVAEIVKKITKNVSVGDCAVGNTPGITKETLIKTGLGSVLEELNIRFRNFQEEPFVNEELNNYQIFESTDFAEAVVEADIIINLPKLKTHGITFYTGAVKNLFGCIMPEERMFLHSKFPNRNEFSQGLVDIYVALKDKVRINILDAVIGMEGDGGPLHGTPKKAGLIIASRDAVALDAVACEIVGYNPMAIPTIRASDERGVGVGDIKRIKILGENLEKAKVADFKKNSLFDSINKQKAVKGYGESFVFQASINREKCQRCGACIQNCPVKAITMKDYPEVDQHKCIHCYCCNESCPHNAIVLKKTTILHQN